MLVATYILATIEKWLRKVIPTIKYNFIGDSAIGGLIFGLLYAPIVITGMHHSFIAVETTLIADATKTGGSLSSQSQLCQILHKVVQL